MKQMVFVLFVLLSHMSIARETPSVQFTSVPGWGTSSPLTGKVQHTTLNDHGVAVYIFVEEAGGWWTKPVSAAPVTPIRPDSGFTTNIVTGGLDQFATKIIAFLVPLSFAPPVMSGGELPGILFSYPYVVSCRPHGDRVISWSGVEWTVKKSVGSPLLPVGPGPNIFSDHDSMVWVDNQQRLHLRVAKTGNTWYCSELICKASQGYSRYQFDIAGRVDLLDPNVIAGMFTWDDGAPYAKPSVDSFRELDIEFSRWGNAADDNAQFVVQPYQAPGNIRRFNMNLSGSDHSVHSFDWKPNVIAFKSSWGDSSCSWEYLNPAGIPVPGSENVRINLHLYNGDPPSDSRDAELIFNSFVAGTTVNQPKSEQVKIFPNPFESGCMVDLRAPGINEVDIGVIDLRGNLLRTLFSGKLNNGSNRIPWDGMGISGKLVSPGLYFISVRDQVKTRYYKVVKL